MAQKSFTLDVPDAAIADLRTRLALTRFPDAAPGEPWAFGTSVEYARELVSYWHDRFDWRAQEAALNVFPQFKTPLHDIDLHYLHVPGVGPNPYPLLLLHGWPGSVYEFLDIIPLLTDPARFGGDAKDAFTVIAPSLPGYGLSFKPGQKRFTLQDIAACVHDLMTETLGFRKFAVQGGDWGAGTASLIGSRYPASVCGIHVNLLFVPRDRPDGELSAEAKRYADDLAHWLREETGYQQIQGTKPQTLAFALTDFRPAWPPGFGKIPLLVRLRRICGECHQPRPHAGEYLAVLVHRSHRLVVLAVLRPAAYDVADLAGEPDHGADRLCCVPQGNPAATTLDRRKDLYQHPTLDRNETRRALRGHGAARSTRRGNPGLLPSAPLT